MNNNLASDVAHELAEDVKQSLKRSGRYATGQTERAIEVIKVTENNSQILAPAYIDAMELGRKPTKTGASAGTPTLREAIEIWMSAKGLTGSAYAIAKKIHEKGYPGKPGVITQPLSDANIEAAIMKCLIPSVNTYTAELEAALL